MSCVCGGIASPGRSDADVGRLARGRSAVGRALKNVHRDYRGKPARQLPARPYVVDVNGGSGLQDSSVHAPSPAPAAMTYIAASLISHA